MGKHKFFLSYASNDNVRGKRVKAFFHDVSESVALALGVPVTTDVGFYSEIAIQSGDEWTPALATAIQEAGVLICLLSPSYFRSNWCGKELAAFLQIIGADQTASGLRVLPLP